MTKALDERSVSPSQEFSNLAFRFNNLNSTAKMLLVGSSSNTIPYIPITDLVSGNPLAYSDESYSLSKLARPSPRVDITTTLAEKPNVKFQTTSRLERAWSVDELMTLTEEDSAPLPAKFSPEAQLENPPEIPPTEYYEKLDGHTDYERVFPSRRGNIESSPWLNPGSPAQNSASSRSKAGLGSLFRKTITPLAVVSGLILLAVTSFNIFNQLQQTKNSNFEEIAETSSIDYVKEGQSAFDNLNETLGQNFYDELRQTELDSSTQNGLAEEAYGGGQELRSEVDQSNQAPNRSRGSRIAPKQNRPGPKGATISPRSASSAIPTLDILQINPSLSYVAVNNQLEAVLPADQFPIHAARFADPGQSAEKEQAQEMAALAEKAPPNTTETEAGDVSTTASPVSPAIENSSAQATITPESEASLTTESKPSSQITSPEAENNISSRIEQIPQTEAIEVITEEVASPPADSINPPIEEAKPTTLTPVTTVEQTPLNDVLDIEPLLRTPGGGIKPVTVATAQRPLQSPETEIFSAEKQLQVYQAQLISLQAKAQSKSLTRSEKRALLSDVNALKQKIVKVKQELSKPLSPETGTSTLDSSTAPSKLTSATSNSNPTSKMTQKTASQRSTEELNDLESDVRQIYRGS